MPHRKKDIYKITVVGLLANVFLCVFKLMAGIVGNSQVVVADGVHSLSDIGTDLAIIVGARFWSEPADRDHPYGHGRLELIVSLGMALFLVGVAAGFVVSALISLHRGDLQRPGWTAFTAAVVSIVVKELLFQWTQYRGRELRSSAVEANAWHHRTDALSSIPAALAVAGARIEPGWAFLDQVGTVIISFFIVHAAWEIGRGAVENLIDRGASRDELSQINALASSIPGVKEVHAIRTRTLGPGWSVDLHLLVDADLTVHEGHDIAEDAKSKLLGEGPDILDVVVHVEPYEKKESLTGNDETRGLMEDSHARPSD